MNKQTIDATTERKKKLFPFLAYVLTRQTDPDFQTLYLKTNIDPTQYRAAQSIEDWTALVQSNEADVNAMVTVADTLTDEDWNKLETKYEQSKAEGSVTMAAKGAKLKVLKSQTGTKVPNPPFNFYQGSKPEYQEARKADSAYHRNHGIKQDLSTILFDDTFSNYDEIRSAERYGYVGYSADDFIKKYEEHNSNPIGTGLVDGREAATIAYLNDNKMLLSNNDVVAIANRIIRAGGKPQWGTSSPMYGDNNYDLSKLLNKVDFDRVMNVVNQSLKQKLQKGGNVHIPERGQLKKIQKRNTGVQHNKDGKPVDAVTKSISRPITMGKEGSKVKKKKKCSCGCDMILTKAAGGKVIETCSCKCGGKLKKK